MSLAPLDRPVAPATPLLVRTALPPAARDLLALSARTLIEASLTADPGVRYLTAHLAGLRAAAAVLAARAIPERRRRERVRSTWEVLPALAPELAEWAGFFAASARVRAAVESGIRMPTARAADDLVRDAEAFLGACCRLLGAPHQPTTRGPA